MGEPALFHRRASVAECIGSGGQPGELKHLSTLRKRKQSGPCEREPFVGAKRDFLSSGERNGSSPNQSSDDGWGCGASHAECRNGRDSRSGLERPIGEGKNPVGEILSAPRRTPSTAGHGEPRGKQGGPPPKAKYSLATDSAPVP